eukprot:Gb_30230 [translate_table: standard]
MTEMPKHPPNAVLVPFPAQDHVNPLMHFANLLAARGCFITTGDLADRNFCPSNEYMGVWSVIQHLQSGLRGFRFLGIGNGLPLGHVNPTNALKFMPPMHKLGPAIIRLLRSFADEAPPITCIVSNCSLIAATYEVASIPVVRRVLFWTFCVTAVIATANSRLLLSKRYIPVKMKEAKRPENLMTYLPGNIPLLWPMDLLASFCIQDTADASFQIALCEAEMQIKAGYVLLNSFEELEGPETISGLFQGYPTLAIGPVFLADLFDKQRAGCSTVPVLHISSGSILLLSNLPVQELAFDGRRGRVLVVEWTPKRKVLSHPSAGGFMTHCEWNGSLESMRFGVPIIGWPLHAYQFFNCMFAKEI